MPADATLGARAPPHRRRGGLAGARRRTRDASQIFRLAGIYGPGRSAIDRLREGTAHRIVKPGQVFNRIHVDDIAAAVIAGIDGRGAEQIYNVTDDEPAPPQDVIAFAAELLHMPPPPEVALRKMRSCRRWRPASMPTTSASATSACGKSLALLCNFRPTGRACAPSSPASGSADLLHRCPDLNGRVQPPFKRAPLYWRNPVALWPRRWERPGSRTGSYLARTSCDRQRVASVVARCAPWR